ncbi:hypothetical protein ACJJIW_13180 [Microbulbifer sp. JMSA004]|uniref:hypothetical protein n=1 Tax=Microbulbifer sp. JMSA004 TaxID=3243370 RepID=UPI0040391988
MAQKFSPSFYPPIPWLSFLFLEILQNPNTSNKAKKITLTKNIETCPTSKKNKYMQLIVNVINIPAHNNLDTCRLYPTIKIKIGEKSIEEIIKSISKVNKPPGLYLNPIMINPKKIPIQNKDHTKYIPAVNLAIIPLPHPLSTVLDIHEIESINRQPY